MKKLSDWVYAENDRAIKFFNFFGARRKIFSRNFFYTAEEFDATEKRVTNFLAEKFSLAI